MKQQIETNKATSEPDWYSTGYWRSEPLWTSFATTAPGAGQAAVVHDGDQHLMLSALMERACRVAGGLAATGVVRGGAVIVQSRNSIDAYAALLACYAQGFVAIPLPPMFSSAQVVSVATSAEAQAVVLLEADSAPAAQEILSARPDLKVIFTADPAVAGGNGQIRPWADCLAAAQLPANPPAPDADAMVLYSSGSTGAPKGVVHSGNSLRFAIEALAKLHRVGPGDRVLVVLEFGFVGGTVLGALAAFMSGADTVLMRRWDPLQCLAAIERHSISYTLLMPTHCYDVLNHPDLDRYATSSLRRAILAGATYEQRIRAMERFCGVALPMYGMSESMAHCTCAEDDDEQGFMKTDGHPLPGTEIQILDENGAAVVTGEIGNVFLRGPNRLRRYQARPDLTSNVIREGGWFSTGDRGRLDAGGCLTFVARASEVIRRGGVMIQPAEVEIALGGHPAIAELVVIGIPDERLGERACACVRPKTGKLLDVDAMKDYLATAGLPRYQWPEYLLTFDEFPRTPSLKVRRSDLAALARARLQDQAS